MKTILLFLMLIPFVIAGQTNDKKGTIKVRKAANNYSMLSPVFDTAVAQSSIMWGFPSSGARAQYTGGEPAIRKFIVQTLKYPENSLYKGIKGTVTLSFAVDTAGAVSDINIDWGIKGCKECDDEAVRILKLMKDWKPGKVREQPVESVGYMNVPFEFLK